MTELSHDRPEPDPRAPDAPHSIEEKLASDPAEGQEVDRVPPEAPEPEPRDAGMPGEAGDLVAGEGVNEGAADIATE
jgi:hypothetical protein